ncbi:MAG TPA: DASS family sodium-coupled anion symporter [Terriglobales bacterium]|nr:DASS family sodium-coupled anion symporter [Terriglobales bacterium]
MGVTSTTIGNVAQAAPSRAETKATIPAWKAVAPLAITIVIAFFPAPWGLAPYAWRFFSIFVGVIVGLILEPLPGAAVAIIGITATTVLAPFALFSPQQLAQSGFHPASAALAWALSGYSNSTVWLIFGAFILALGYDKTGLGHRIALIIIKRMGKSTLLLGYGIALADLMLAPFIPSPTARSGGIIYPIANDLALDYGSKPNDASSRRVGSYLMWVAIMTTCVTSSLFLTGASFNLLAAGYVEKLAHLDLSWTDWFITAAPAIILLLILVPLLSYWLYPPEVKRNGEVSKWAATQLEKIGPLTRQEMILAGVVVLSLVLWVGGGAYVGAATVAFIAVSLMLITRVLTWNDVAAHKRAWTTFAWLGALIALCDGLNRVGFVKWFAEGIAAHMRGFSPHLAMIILLVLFFVAHYVFASVDAYTTALLPVILLTGAAIPGIPVKEFALLLCMELGIMGVITPFADAASPVYANSGYLPAKDYWRLGTIFGAIFLVLFLGIGVPWASLLWNR